MRRLLVVTDRLSLRGGAERYLRELLELTRGTGLEWHVAFGHDDPTATPLAALHESTTRVRGLDVGVPDRREGRVIEAVRELRDRIGADVVLVQNALSPALLADLADDERSVLVVHDHRAACPAAGKTLPDGSPCGQRVGAACGPCLPDARYRDLRIELVLARLDEVRRFPHVVAASAALAGWLTDEGVQPERLVVAPPAVPRWARDAGPLVSSARRRGVVTLGRLAEHKGCFHLLRALARRGFADTWTWVGDGPARLAFEREAKTLGVDVRVTGWLDDTELAAVVGACRVAVVPSWWAEPFGLAGLEASALGLPVVAAAIGGIPEWLAHGETGLLTPPGDGDALAGALARTMDDTELADRLGRQGREHVRALFRPDAFLDAWRAVLPTG